MRPFYESNQYPAYFSYGPCGSFPEHLHNQVELFYLYAGTADMLVDGQAYALNPGDMAICFPGMVHGYGLTKDAERMMIIFSPSVSADFSMAFSKSMPVCPILRRDMLPPDVVRAMEILREECAGSHDNVVMRAYLQVILARTVPLMQLEEQTYNAADVVQQILQYLALHFTEPISLAGMAKALNISESHLSHTFSQRLRTGFRAYVNTLRLDRACTLLSTTERSITEILYECGFGSARTFNRTFTEQYGVTPSEFRQQQHRQRPVLT